MYSFIQKLIDQGFALVYIDISLLPHTKTRLLDLIEQIHQKCTSDNLKIASENRFISSSQAIFLDKNLQ